MYFKNISDEDLILLHNTIKINKGYNELKTEDVFITAEPHKLIPLFYLDRITGSDKVRVLDDKVVLYTDINDLDDVYFESDIVSDVGLVWDFVDGYLKLHFFDIESLFNLNRLSFNISNTSNGFNENNVTDNYGNAVININNQTGTYTVIVNNKNIVIEVE
ncbi:hypothetical protein [Methanobrevibacter sp.]